LYQPYSIIFSSISNHITACKAFPFLDVFFIQFQAFILQSFIKHFIFI
jgi:hypothetical protein